MLMVPDPDNKMDELLKLYAKKRREQTGEPLEMHPAMRNQLQAEAGKLAPKESRSAGSGLNWLKIFWPRVAFALSLFIALAIGTWAFFRTEPGRMQFSKLDVKKRGAATSSEGGSARGFVETPGRSPAPTGAEPEKLAETSKRTSQGTTITPRLEVGAGIDKDRDTARKQAEALLKREAKIELKQRYDLIPETQAPAAAPAPQTASVTLKAEPAPTTSSSITAPVAREKEVTSLSTEARLDSLRDGVAPKPATAPVLTPSSAVPDGTSPPGERLRALTSVGGFGGGVDARAGGNARGERGLGAQLPSSALAFGIDRDGSQPTKTLELAGKNSAFGESDKTNAARLSLAWNRDAYQLFDDAELIQNAAALTNQLLARWNITNGRISRDQENPPLATATDEVAGTSGAFATTPALYARRFVNGPAAGTQKGEPTVRYRMTNQVAAISTEAYYFATTETLRQRKDEIAKGAEGAVGQKEAAPIDPETKAKADVKSGGFGTILNAFDIEQVGDRMRITEADGSVYEVRFFAAVADDARQTKVQANRRDLLKRASAEDPGKRLETIPGIQNFSFEAVGINRSLNQLVTVSGIWSTLGRNEEVDNLAATATTMSSERLSLARSEPRAVRAGISDPQPVGIAGQATDPSSAVQGLVAPPTRIRGKVRIGTNEFGINAVRLTP